MDPSRESTFVCPIIIEDDRTGLDTETIRRALRDNLLYIQGKLPELASKNNLYMALAYTIRNRLLQRSVNHPTNLSKKRCQNRLLSLGRIFSLVPT
jgi:starch phosphorylase